MSDIEMPTIDYMGTIAMQSRIIDQQAARIEQLEARLRFWCKAHEAQETELFIAAYESTRAALGEKE